MRIKKPQKKNFKQIPGVADDQISSKSSNNYRPMQALEAEVQKPNLRNIRNINELYEYLNDRTFVNEEGEIVDEDGTVVSAVVTSHVDKLRGVISQNEALLKEMISCQELFEAMRLDNDEKLSEIEHELHLSREEKNKISKVIDRHDEDSKRLRNLLDSMKEKKKKISDLEDEKDKILNLSKVSYENKENVRNLQNSIAIMKQQKSDLSRIRSRPSSSRSASQFSSGHTDIQNGHPTAYSPNERIVITPERRIEHSREQNFFSQRTMARKNGIHTSSNQGGVIRGNNNSQQSPLQENEDVENENNKNHPTEINKFRNWLNPKPHYQFMQAGTDKTKTGGSNLLNERKIGKVPSMLDMDRSVANVSQLDLPEVSTVNNTIFPSIPSRFKPSFSPSHIKRSRYSSVKVPLQTHDERPSHSSPYYTPRHTNLSYRRSSPQYRRNVVVKRKLNPYHEYRYNGAFPVQYMPDEPLSYKKLSRQREHENMKTFVPEARSPFDAIDEASSRAGLVQAHYDLGLPVMSKSDLDDGFDICPVGPILDGIMKLFGWRNPVVKRFDVRG